VNNTESFRSNCKSRCVNVLNLYSSADTVNTSHPLPNSLLYQSLLRVVSFDDLSAKEGGGVQLGYAQVIFAPASCVDAATGTHRDTMTRFMDVTFEGWRRAIADPASAAEDVLALQPSDVDHFLSTPDFVCESVRRCCSYVKRTRAGDKLGIVDPGLWTRANEWVSKTV
jgi:hypothetical protein